MSLIPEALNCRYELTPDITWRDVDGELVVLDLIKGKYYTFNQVGTKIWQIIADDDYNLISFANDMVEKYEIKRQTVLEDIEKFLQKMISAKLIKERGQNNFPK